MGRAIHGNIAAGRAPGTAGIGRVVLDNFIDIRVSPESAAGGARLSSCA
jgi:hypothetical protein